MLRISEGDVTQKHRDRARLAEDVAEYLDRGGTIEQLSGPGGGGLPAPGDRDVQALAGGHFAGRRADRKSF